MDIKHSFEKLKSVFTSDKKLAVLCAVGVLGAVLLIISEFIPSGEKKTEKKESVTAAQSQETYAEDIEKRLTEIVSSIVSFFIISASLMSFNSGLSDADTPKAENAPHRGIIIFPAVCAAA